MQMAKTASDDGQGLHPPVSGESLTIETRFGPMDFFRENTITLPQGLIGYSNFRDFGLTQLPDNGLGQLMLLQCLSEPSLSFIVAVYNTDSDIIEPADLREALRAVGVEPDNALILLVVTIRKALQGVEVTANLRAPLIIDSKTKTGRQYVLPNSKYDVRCTI